ncbi:MAG: NAD(P)(+) transhydrogenase (Re/Si-specific) subunit beta, partial [Pseudomonadota bacterium]
MSVLFLTAAAGASTPATTASNVTALAYLAASVLFILSLRGLSSPETSRQGNTFGMVGMLIAVITTIVNPTVMSYAEIGIAIAIGGAIGYIIAQKIAMTDMPQLVAAFHSLVGMA